EARSRIRPVSPPGLPKSKNPPRATRAGGNRSALWAWKRGLELIALREKLAVVVVHVIAIDGADDAVRIHHALRNAHRLVVSEHFAHLVDAAQHTVSELVETHFLAIVIVQRVPDLLVDGHARRFFFGPFANARFIQARRGAEIQDEIIDNEGLSFFGSGLLKSVHIALKTRIDLK